MFCPNCNATEHEIGAKFCHVCGYVLEDIPHSALISKGTMALRKETKYIIIHYSPAIKNYHGNDVGYHYLIDKNGVVHNGRFVNLEGCHSGKYNRDSISVCFESNEKRINDKQVSKDAVMLIFLLSFMYGARICFFDELTGQYNSFIGDNYRSVLVNKIQERQGWYMELPGGEDWVDEWFNELCHKFNIPYDERNRKLIFW